MHFSQNDAPFFSTFDSLITIKNSRTECWHPPAVLLFFPSSNVNFEHKVNSQPIKHLVAFVASVDQDQAAQNVQPDLRSTVSAFMKYLRQKQP